MPLPYHRSKASLSSKRGDSDSGDDARHTRNTSLALSPLSLFSYSESDPFLSPTTTRSSPPSPRFFHPSSPVSPSPYYSDAELDTSFPAPMPARKGGAKGGLLGQLHLPPSAKRARSSTWILMGAAALVTVALVVSLPRSTLSQTKLVEYGSKATNRLVKLAPWRVDGHGLDAGGADELEELVSDEGGEIPITALPRPRLPDRDARDVKYLCFLPHSGFHNQRLALQNALLLGKLLNRTVLLPPVWIGWPVPTQHYTDLRQSWLDIMLTNPASFNLSTVSPDSPLNRPASFASSTSDYPCPTCAADNSTLLAEVAAATAAKLSKWREAGYEVRPDGAPIIPGLKPEDCKSYSPECRFTYRDTFLSWDFLVDLDRARKDVGVEVVDRWDVREGALVEQLGVDDSDVYVVEDRETYDFQFSDRAKEDAPLIDDNQTSSHYKRTVSIRTLATLEHRVVLLGSLFGTGRVRIYNEPRAHEWSEALGRAMAFRNPWLLRPADAIVSRLGGRANFVGVHARVGDGEFARRARHNMERAWRDLVVGEMGVDEDVAEEVWEKVRPNVLVGRGRGMRDEGRRPAEGSADATAFAAPAQDDSATGAGKVNSLAERGLLDEVKAWLPSSFAGADEPASRLRNLTCRAPLHDDPRLQPFNTPLYLATDSRTPEQDLNLRAFFAAFPCTFVLGDFDRPDEARNDGVVVESVERMGRLVNSLDGVPLGRLFLPFLEAIVAAKGRLVVGTEHSTFSAFASTSLHDAYWAE